jgi:hypothetical protein
MHQKTSSSASRPGSLAFASRRFAGPRNGLILAKDHISEAKQSEPLPHIEFYRGMTITCELSHANASRQMIDRLWAMRIAAAPNAAARWEILEDELRLIEQTRSRRTTRASKNPLGRPRKVRENAELV